MDSIKVYGAPMAGVSDYPFRQIVRLFGDHVLFSEMIGARTLVDGYPKTIKMLTFKNEYNIVAQLVGNDPIIMGRAAKILTDAGVAGIDINMGCPVRKLIQNHSGALLMQDQDLACHLVEAVKNSTHIPVSVKTRLGWISPTDIYSFAEKLVSAGATQIEIHARTWRQGYTGKANWHILNNLSLPIPVVINGDIRSAKTAQQALQQSGTDGVMIGRSLLGKPWILKEIETGTKTKCSILDLALRHLDLMLSYYGHAGLYIARKHLAWYAMGKKGVAKWRERMYLEEDEQELRKLIQDFWEGEEP